MTLIVKQTSWLSSIVGLVAGGVYLYDVCKVKGWLDQLPHLPHEIATAVRKYAPHVFGMAIGEFTFKTCWALLFGH